MNRSLVRRHYRLVSVVGGIAFAVLVWVANGSRLTLVDAFLIVIIALTFAGGMWAAGRAASRRT
jgi:hypothetical protein